MGVWALWAATLIVLMVRLSWNTPRSRTKYPTVTIRHRQRSSTFSTFDLLQRFGWTYDPACHVWTTPDGYEVDEASVTPHLRIFARYAHTGLLMRANQALRRRLNLPQVAAPGPSREA